MSKLIYGRNGQVRFYSEAEKEEAIQYILTSSNVDYQVHEDNQDQGAWGSEERIHFHSSVGVPECLRRNMTAGRGSMYGRINCKEFCEEIRMRAGKDKATQKKSFSTKNVATPKSSSDSTNQNTVIIPSLKKGMDITHKTYGIGTITNVQTSTDLLKVKFMDSSEKQFSIKFSFEKELIKINV